MFKLLKADRDAYITDRVIDGTRKTASNTGGASSLDLFKLYGISSSASLPNIELSRLLLHFNLNPIRALVTNGTIDLNNPTFRCNLRLFDVNGGQTVPTNFTVVINPLSRSFSEGIGRDVVLYGDSDVCNFLTGSVAQGAWLLSGANQGGHATGSIDYITTALLNNITSSLSASQLFTSGIEDLNVDVTKIISATLTNQIPDEGFRIAFTPSIETDTKTYFVKRFAARTAFDNSYHPRLEVRFDDSVQDDSLNLEFDSNATMFLYNFDQGTQANILSSSIAITGSNSLILKLETAISGGFYNLFFTGSQHTVGGNQLLPVSGVYSASIIVPSTDNTIANKLDVSGSVDFVPIWGSLDGTVAFHTGSKLTVRKSLRGASTNIPFSTIVTVTNVLDKYDDNQIVPLKVNVFDKNSPRIIAVKLPVNFPGLVIRDVHYQVRDINSDEKIIPFDTTYNSTRVSSDGDGMFFKLDTSSLIANRSYVIDIMLVKNGENHVHNSVSSVFKVVKST